MEAGNLMKRLLLEAKQEKRRSELSGGGKNGKGGGYGYFLQRTFWTWKLTPPHGGEGRRREESEALLKAFSLPLGESGATDRRTLGGGTCFVGRRFS